MGHEGFTAKSRRRPTIEKRTVAPRRPKNADVRPREYLTAEEVERLLAAAKKGTRRHPHRDATMILLAYRHGLRASELVGVRWDMLDLEQGTFHVARRKNGRPAVHLLRGLGVEPSWLLAPAYATVRFMAENGKVTNKMSAEARAR